MGLEINIMEGHKTELLISEELVMNLLYYLRGYKIMIDSDLAALY